MKAHITDKDRKKLQEWIDYSLSQGWELVQRWPKLNAAELRRKSE